jgi:acyl-CoA thioesterase-2
VGPDGFPSPTQPDAREEGSLERATLDALDRLLAAFMLEPFGGDRFRASGEADRFDRVFGGQLVAQALLAAAATASMKEAHSLHAYFVEAGTPGAHVEISVDRVRDGRSIATRRVTVRQQERTVLVAMISLRSGFTELTSAGTTASVAGPDGLPLLQDWVREFSPEQRVLGRSWVEQPPPLELRMDEAPYFMGGQSAQGPRTHWMRLPRSVGEDPLVHTALLAYASDYLLLDMILRAQPDGGAATSLRCVSLDHSLWFHGPVRLDRWHRHTQESQAIAGQHGLVRGMIHDAGGRLVASVMQEGLVRPGF